MAMAGRMGEKGSPLTPPRINQMPMPLHISFPYVSAYALVPRVMYGFVLWVCDTELNIIYNYLENRI